MATRNQLIKTACKAQKTYFSALHELRQEHGIDINAATPSEDWDLDRIIDDAPEEDDCDKCLNCGEHPLSGRCNC